MYFSFDGLELAGGELLDCRQDREGEAVGAQLALFDPGGWDVADRTREAPTASPAVPSGPTVEEAIDQYCKAKRLALGTTRGYATTREKWRDWSSSLRSRTPMVAQAVTAEDLADFLGWVHESAESAEDDNPGRTHNKVREHLRAVFRWLMDEGRLEALVRFPARREQRSVRGHYYLTRAEMSSLYWATYRMKNPRGWSDSRSIGSLWRTALVLWFFYGLDTHALMYCKGKQRLCWRHIVYTDLPPGRAAKVKCPHGWIRLKRQKTGKLLLFPMHRLVRAHLDLIRPADAQPDDPIFGKAGRSKPNDVFRALTLWAKLPEKVDAETGDVVAWIIQDLRKTCATSYGERRGKLILGHADGSITGKHYANRLPVVCKAVRTVKSPRAFRSIIDERVKPPAEMLFAK